MSNKFFLKIVVAFGLLTLALAFLGANYVPRSLAVSSVKVNPAAEARYAGSDYYLRHNTSIYAGSDWIERHPAAMINPMMYAGSDWIERHPAAAANPVNYGSSDYFERHPSNYYDNSDWFERHSGQRNP